MISVGRVIRDTTGHLERWIERGLPRCEKQRGTRSSRADRGI